MILKLKRTNVDVHYDLASKRLRSMWRLDSAGSASSYMTCTVRLIIIITALILDSTLRIGWLLLQHYQVDRCGIDNVLLRTSNASK